MKNYINNYLLGAIFLLPAQAQALTIVTMDVHFDSTSNDVYLELYDEQTPINATNFLGYIDRGDYDTSLIHRQAFTSQGEPFVLQGGGFTYVPEFDPDAVFCGSFGAALFEASDPVTGELGLRPFDEIYFVDADNNNVPDNVGANEGLVDASLAATNSCVQIGDIYRTNTALQYIPVDTGSLPITSEAGISNLKGTLAMALTGAGADSATNQWFINMKDNVQLDTQNGGFTVFGKLLGTSIDVFDSVMSTALPDPLFSQIVADFSELPLVGHEQFTRALDENLVKINSAESIFSIDSSSHDFGYVPVAGNAQKVITLSVSSTRATPVVISAVEATDTLAAPYTLVTDCDGATVNPGNSCSITIDFDPVLEDSFDDTFDISFTDPPIPSIVIPITGNSRDLPQVIASDSTLNFEFLFPGLTKNKTVELRNNGLQTLNLTNITLDNTTEFALTHDCVAPLVTDATCELTLVFQPQSSGIKLATVSIESNDPDSPFSILLVGAGSGDVIPDIEASSELAMGDTFINVLEGFISVSNVGGTELTVSDIVITGADASEFSVEFTDCTVLQINESCSIVVNFTPLTLGDKSAVLTITSDDPDEQNFDVSLSGSRSADSDRISDTIELAAPNSGDADNDGITDDLQGNVVSLPSLNGEYITIKTDAIYRFTTAELIDTPAPDDLPSTANLEFGVYSIVLEGTPASGIYEVGFFLPRGASVDAVYIYGPTADDTSPHWYESPAQILNDVLLSNTTSGDVFRSVSKINIGDGFEGDADLQTNGELVTQIAISITRPSGGSSSSSLGLISIISVMMVLLVARARRS